ncbi:hypothetical protein PAXINDRAFT_158676, partial [Paxillus involutus ATCC 200175]
MDLSDEPDFAWARRHTAHSWRERYKKNQPRLDPLIDDHAEQQKDVGHHFGHDARSRRHRLLWYYKEEEEDEEGEGEEQEHQGRKRQREEEEGPTRGGVAARDYLARNEQILLAFEGGD